MIPSWLPMVILAQQVESTPTTLSGYVWLDLLMVGGLIVAVFALVWFVKRM